MKYKNFVLFILVSFLSILLAAPAGQFYQRFIRMPVGFGSFIIPIFWYNFTDGIILSFIFFLTLLFTAFGDQKKYWWIGILLIPAALFEVYFDLAHIYFPIALGLLGWLVGKGIEMVVPKLWTQKV
ncbi:MAG: hypothetical protein HY983_03345 [Candidatus Magasanikbacteria bacterium]|nr:hypothetical protein [Candidatus Magasanikbacteria bacterium]